jgi:hypothetical protein
MGSTAEKRKFTYADYKTWPDDEMVEQYRLLNGRYLSDLFNWDQKLPLFAFPDLELQLWEVFEKELAEIR